MIHNFVCLCPFPLGKDALNFSSILKHIYVRSNPPYGSFNLVYSWDTANCWAHKLLTKPSTSSSGDELIAATSWSLHKQRLKLFSCTLMQPPKTSPSCAGPKCALRNSVRTSEGLGMTESWHRNERCLFALCRLPWRREGKVWSSAWADSPLLTELLSGLSLNKL